MTKATITFDNTVAPLIMELLTAPNTTQLCYSCSKPVTAKTLGGAIKLDSGEIAIFHEGLPCLLELSDIQKKKQQDKQSAELAAELKAGKYKIIQTCGSCPEQYEMYHGKKMIGYFRLRHGRFRADYPDAGDETVYEAFTIGDGNFHDEDERKKHMEAATRIIKERYEHDSKKA